MDIAVDISLYPLAEAFRPMIHDFIGRLAAHEDLKVVPGSLSTQVFGEYERVFEALRAELRVTLEARQAGSGQAVFVIKLLGPI